MLVHPETTTGAQLDAEKDAPNYALHLLRLTLSLVGAKNAQFYDAFKFVHFEVDAPRHGTRRQEKPTLDKQSTWIWSIAEDFWHVIGWAFNCSVLHPARWDHWQIWLEFICTVLEDDWAECEIGYAAAQKQKALETQQREESGSVEPPEQGARKPGRPRKDDKKDDGLEIFRESLIYKYIKSNITYGRDRRIMRAIFADGQPKSAEFREVFYNELRKSKSKQDSSNNKKRPQKVNLEKGEYGDYQMESDEDYSTPTTRKAKSKPPAAKGIKVAARRIKRTRAGTRNAMNEITDSDMEMPDADHDSGLSSLGGYNALALRSRLIGLLSCVSERIPRDFVPLDDLYSLYVENIRDLPLPIFQHLISPSNLPGLVADAQCSLCELLLFVMRESSAPASSEHVLTADKLEKCFLPYAAASPTVVNNAKISLLIEALITLLHQENAIVATPQLKQALQKGIDRRQSVCRDHSTVEWSYLYESGFRMKFIVDHVLEQGT
jgi:hypothetical protein